MRAVRKSRGAVAAGRPDHVLVPDVAAAGNLVRQDDAVAGIWTGLGQSRRVKQRVVAPGRGVAGMVPAGDVLELDVEDGALKAVHARVPAQLVVVVAAAHAVLAQHFYPLGQFIGVGGDHARFAGGAEVLGGIKAEGGNLAKGAGLYAVPFGAPGLGGVFNELEPIASPRREKARQSAHWP